MRRADAIGWALSLGLAIGAILLVARSCSVARGQEDDALCAARLCVREAGWHSPADCAAILHAVQATSREDEGVCERLRRVGRRTRPGRAWADALPARSESGPPIGWPAAVPWEAYRQRWDRVLGAHRRWLAGRQPRPCDGIPLAWGMPVDDHVALARGLRRLDCGRTVNRFWGRR